MFSWLRSCNTKRLMINISIWTRSFSLSHTRSASLSLCDTRHTLEKLEARQTLFYFVFLYDFLLYFFFGYFSRKFSFTHFTRLCFLLLLLPQQTFGESSKRQNKTEYWSPNKKTRSIRHSTGYWWSKRGLSKNYTHNCCCCCWRKYGHNFLRHNICNKNIFLKICFTSSLNKSKPQSPVQ